MVSLAPVGPLEAHLAERMVVQGWRLERAQRVERETLEGCLAEAHYRASNRFADLGSDDLYRLHRPRPETEAPAQVAFHWEGLGVERILRYEGQVERTFFRHLHELGRLQLRRRGCEVPPSLVKDLPLSAPGVGFVPADPSPGGNPG